MRKKLLCMLSVITAFIMSFTLVGCGGNDPNGEEQPGGQTKPVTAAAVASAVSELYGAEGFSGNVGFEFSTSGGANDMAFNGSLLKRGSKLKFDTAGASATSYIYDTATGYGYKSTPDGYVYSQIAPAGLFGYAEYLMGSIQLPEELENVEFTYDKTSGASVFTFDAADSVNAVLEPLYSAYEFGKPISKLLDAYFEIFTDGAFTFTDLKNVMEVTVAGYKDMPISAVLPVLGTALGIEIDIDTIFEKLGITLTPEQKQAVGERKIGEMIAGVYEYLKAFTVQPDIPSETNAVSDEGSDLPVGDGMQTILDGLFNALFFDEVDPSAVDKDLSEIKMLIDTALSVKVNVLVDKYVSVFAPELYTMIRNGVTFEKLKAGMAVKLDVSGKLSEIELVGAVKHTYNGETVNGFTLLADNDYVMTAELSGVAYSAPDEFDMQFKPNAGIDGELAVFVYGGIESDISVYAEHGGNELSVTGVLTYFVADGNFDEIENNGDAVWNAADSSVVFGKEFIERYFAEAERGSQIIAMLDAEAGGELFNIRITLTKMPDDIGGFADFGGIADYILGMIGGLPGNGGNAVFAV